MNLTQVFILSFLAIIAGCLIPKRWRIWFLLTSSLFSIYWLQPSSPIRNLDFWFPTISILLTLFVWIITQKENQKNKRALFTTIAVIIGIILFIGLTRYFNPSFYLTASRPPGLFQIMIVLGLGMALASLPAIFPNKRFWSIFSIAFIIFLFILQKTELFAQNSSAFLRTLNGQSPELASHLDLTWLGFSYLAFRLIHVIRDYQMGKLPTYSLAEFATYALFFPTYTAGPIDRSQRFMGDLPERQSITNQQEANTQHDVLYQTKENFLIGAQRIIVGIFIKFVLADSLALIALNEQNASQVSSSFWMWVLLVSYALRIFFDFSGYTDIAIGLGRFMNFRLPENFDRPYTKKNLTEFWNSWHITLAQWFRAYYFFPLTRTLRTKLRKFPAWSIIFIGQFSTMAFIGLWHGINWNFFIWGIWHGTGLFIHNRWLDWTRKNTSNFLRSGVVGLALDFASWLLTFSFVTVGWVWFALPNLAQSWQVIQTLLTIR